MRRCERPSQLKRRNSANVYLLKGIKFAHAFNRPVKVPYNACAERHVTIRRPIRWVIAKTRCNNYDVFFIT